MGNFMRPFKFKNQKWTLALTLLFLITYLFQDSLYNKLWLFPYCLMLLSGLILIIIFIRNVVKKDWSFIPLLGLTILIVTLAEIQKSEIFKSVKILEATLKDDLSLTYLTLRKNNTFEVNPVTMFSDEKFKGKYKLLCNKIIFLDKPYINDFIPDTVTIINDKIILRFKNNGEPNMEFANFFSIKTNRLKNCP